MMYVVLLDSKNFKMLSELIPELKKEFPNENFSIDGSEEKGYRLRINGLGDEKLPRAFALKFVKNWKPKPIYIEG